MYPRREALLARTPGVRPYRHVLNANIFLYLFPLVCSMSNHRTSYGISCVSNPASTLEEKRQS